MFKFEELSDEKKSLIELIGDHTKTRVLDPYSLTKSLKRIYEAYYSKRMKYEDFVMFTEELYYDGLISYVPASISFVDNLSDEANEDFKRHFDLENSWRNQNGLIRLTHQGERTITGTDIYLQIIKDTVSVQYKRMDAILDETDDIKKDYNLIKSKLDGSLIKNIEILTIFIAIVALIGGNISVFANYTFTSLYEIIILLLVTNAILLFVFMSFLVMMKRIILSNQEVSLIVDFKSIIFPIVLIIIALIIAA